MEFHDPLTYPQIFAWNDAIEEVQALYAKHKGAETLPQLARVNFLLLPGILPSVKAWKLKNIPKEPTLETFPATPNQAAGELMEWLRGEMVLLISGVKAPEE
ncbi:unnamed protein product [marine sediment metagenome]|uniref:Uncharacterized protein n=1 Tax=marine sediment metagenome TaxID=412755 RepID=X0SDP0_9ZZZZ